MSLPVEEHTRESVLEKMARGESLKNAKLKGLDLSSVSLRGADLRGAQFRYSDLSESDLREADLRKANLRHVNLRGADLTRADLRGADFTHADIHGAVLTGAQVAGAKFTNTKGLSQKVFFPEALFAELIAHRKSELHGDGLHVPERNEHWKVEAAARIVDLVSGEDAGGILHRVLTQAEMKDMKLEVSGELARHGETTYRIEAGMLGLPLHERKPQREPAVVPASSNEPSKQEVLAAEVDDKKSDQELINEFLLTRLTSS